MVITYNHTNYGIEPNQWKPGETWEQRQERLQALLMQLWKKLPIDHPRTVAWILATFAHHQHCYQDPTVQGSWSDKMLIYPVPLYKLEHFTDDPRFSDEWREKEQAAIAQKNADIESHAHTVATWDNHDAVVIIRRFYPEFGPDTMVGGVRAETLLEGENIERPGSWWETMAAQPTPEACPGQYDKPHPVNGSWCQMCG